MESHLDEIVNTSEFFNRCRFKLSRASISRFRLEEIESDVWVSRSTPFNVAAPQFGSVSCLILLRSFLESGYF